MDIAWDLDPATDLPLMADGSRPNRVPLPVFRHVTGWERDNYYNVYCILQMFCDVSPEWQTGPGRLAARLCRGAIWQLLTYLLSLSQAA
jgi:hypothetical protein